MPARNGGEFLLVAVESILGQSLTGLELLLVDDHSSDGSLQNLANADPRLKVIKCSGRGVVSAFNQGMAECRGRFIARMDADDIAMPQRFEAQLAYLENNPSVDIAGACVEIISEEPLAGGNLHYQKWLNSVRSPGQIRRQLFIESPIPNPTALFRREALFQLSGYRDVEWPEDYDLFLRADAAGMRMGKPDGVLLQWREHGKRLTRTDERYSRLRFQQAKAHFLARHRLPAGPVIIWGAGPGGRQFHDLLKAEDKAVQGFIDVHPRRIGGSKRGLPVWSHDAPGDWADGVILVAVGARGVKAEIRSLLDKGARCEGTDYLFVI